LTEKIPTKIRDDIQQRPVRQKGGTVEEGGKRNQENSERSNTERRYKKRRPIVV
jgi:hypothetical protein